jgi:peptidoglycan/xylan/chitin deacetylase (PgdA/CDA1 family)
MLRVLTYHRVAEPDRAPHLNPRLISASPLAFARQMQHVANHYRPVHLLDVLEAVETGRPLPPRSVLVTFDDGYRDFLEVALPILKTHRIPSVLFVPTAYPDRPDRAFWWDRLHRCLTDPAGSELVHPLLGKIPLRTQAERRIGLRAVLRQCKQIPHDEAMVLVEEIGELLGETDEDYASVLSWDELRGLPLHDVTVCAHTRWHPLLTRVNGARARDEIIGSQTDIEDWMGDGLPVFCYPDGAHDDTVVDIARKAGFVLAFTQVDGHGDLGTGDLLRLPRTNVTPRTTLPIFRLRLQRWFTHIDRWRHHHHPLRRQNA